MRRLRGKAGFTLVELSLSIVFIAILSLTIVFIINDAITTYRRGLTLNQINTIGMDLVDDFRVAIQGSPPVTLRKLCAEIEGADCSTSDGKKAAAGLISKRLMINDSVLGNNIPVGGVFCAGTYSYIWNSGYLFSDSVDASSISFVYKSEDSDSKVTMDNFRLLKVKDAKRNLCKGLSSTGTDNKIDISDNEDGALSDGDVMELLLAEESSTGLAVYDLSSSLPATNAAGKTSLYSASFVLGTVQGGANIKAIGDFCKTPSSHDDKENFDYCAINKFNFAAQANGG